MPKQINWGLVHRARANLDRVKQDHPDTRAMDEAELHTALEDTGTGTDTSTATSNTQLKATYSPAEVAELLGTHKETVLRAIRKGELRAALLGKMYRITAHEVDRYFQSKGGSPLFGGEA